MQVKPSKSNEGLIKAGKKRMGREATESLMESLMAVIVSSYSSVNKPELAARRIEAIGFQVGHQLSERYTMDRPSFTDNLEAIKFICKEFWSELFKKQIDNLKTNHRGTFVLQDNRFRWLAADPSMETSSGSIQEAEATGMHLYFPCGIIRGALQTWEYHVQFQLIYQACRHALLSFALKHDGL